MKWINPAQVVVASLLACSIQWAYAEDDLSSLTQQIQQSKLRPSEILKNYQSRSEQYNPGLQAIYAWNPQATLAAHAADKLNPRNPLHGLPIMVKDNIEVQGMLTTAGSLALNENLAQQDAPVIARLRAAGAIIAGKTNLSEWANLRSTQSTSGWSSAGGQVRNPYAPDRSPCGSSSGSGAAVAARLIPAAIGTETDGSIVCPASVNGLVGLKPTIGLVSRSGIIPLSHSQDTAGPMTLSVRDAALLLNVMAGSDKTDPATRLADKKRSKDYLADLKKEALQGKRLGVVRSLVDSYDTETKALFEQTLELLKAQGAIIVDQVELAKMETLEQDELKVLLTEFKADLNFYLTRTPAAVKVRTMADVIAYNKAHADKMMPYFAQELLEQAQATKGLQDPAYRQASARIKTTAQNAIMMALNKHKLDALIAPTTGPAWKIDYTKGDVVEGAASTPAAVAGYPHLTVPMGLVRGLPVGLSLFSSAWSEANLLAMGYAFEQARMPLPLPAMLQTTHLAQPDAESKP